MITEDNVVYVVLFILAAIGYFSAKDNFKKLMEKQKNEAKRK